MTNTDKHLLAAYEAGDISPEELYSQFSVDITHDFSFVKEEVLAAMERKDPAEVQQMVALIWLSGNAAMFTDLLNELLIYPHHFSHQHIAKTLQDHPSPSSIPFVRKALESGFDYLEYTYSEPETIAKWFSWLLYAIGTTDAIDLMKEYSHSENEGIKKEMQYRLRKIKG